jgi:hypothetical protein
MVTEQQAVEHQKPERGYRDQQRRDARRNYLLGIGERQIATHQQQNADGCEMAEFERRETDASSGERAVGEHRNSGNQKAHGAHHARRNLLDGDADAEIS